MKNNIHIKDTFGRKHDYLRISLTERCNLRCFYCMPEEGVALRDKAEFMSAEELLFIAKSFVDLGVKKIRLTGGEPLVKKNADMIIRGLSKLPIELAITTNGILVDKYIDLFKKVNINSVNISLDTLKKDKFKSITRRDYFDRVMSNINLLIKENFFTKINVVLIKGVNDDEIIDFINWTKDYPIHIRFIEFMPFNGNSWNKDKSVSFNEIMNLINQNYKSDSIKSVFYKPNDTSRNFVINDYKGTFGIISTITNPFCDSCNRIRLTADGKMKNCLFSSDESDLLSNLRKGEDIRQLILNNIYSKKISKAGIKSFNSIDDQLIFSNNRSMVSIGG